MALASFFLVEKVFIELRGRFGTLVAEWNQFTELTSMPTRVV